MLLKEDKIYVKVLQHFLHKLEDEGIFVLKCTL